ncbi:hypothetical protein BD560DRAFT_365520 [Blakeslea trispora]|nr:hypothetical protein BD560DRAFT_365520 [Blakeslea trispora]
MKYIAICKALYDYKTANREEISFNADDVLYILDNSDPGWYKAQIKTPPDQDIGAIGLVPSNYIEKVSPIGTVKALYDYTAQSVEEVSFEENELLKLYEKDDVNWYLVEKKSGDIGLVPSNYVEEQTATNTPSATAKIATHEPLKKKAVALFDFKAESKEETDLTEHEHIFILDSTSSADWWTIQHQDGSSGLVPATYVRSTDKDDSQEKPKEDQAKEVDKLNHQRELEQKERDRQAEIERRRKLQEEAKQKELEAKRQASMSMRSPQTGSPKRSDISAPPPPSSSEQQDPTKPDSTKVRLWTDRTGAFKVEAQFLLCANGKIRLFKTNGVKIDVPVEKMCTEDLRYIEQETNLKLVDDHVPLAHFARFSWLDFFKRANLPSKASTEYAQAFEVNQLTEKDIERLTYKQMKLLGMTDRHVQRMQRFMETRQAEPASDDEIAAGHPSSKPKIKKSVTFGGVSYIDDHPYSDDEEEEGSHQWQIQQDEAFARQLQQQEDSASHDHVSLRRRGTGRPTPAHAAPRDIDSTVLAPQHFHSAPLVPTVAAPSPPTQTSAQTLPTQASANTNNSFDDDAWAPRAGTSPAITAPHLNSGPSSSPSLPQRPSQQSLVDPQMVAKWGGSPSLAYANTRPVPPVPAKDVPMINRNHVPLNQLHHSSMPNLHQTTSPSLQHNMAPLQHSNSMASLQQSSNISPLPVQPQPTSNSAYSFNGSNHFAPSPTPQQANMLSHQFSQPIPPQNTASVPLQSVLPTPLVPQSSPSYLQPQMTGANRNWANATPDNPFGGNQSSPLAQHQVTNNPNLQYQQPQVTGFTNQTPMLNQANSNLGFNDKYAVFKNLDTSTPSIFNSNNHQNSSQNRNYY